MLASTFCRSLLVACALLACGVAPAGAATVSHSSGEIEYATGVGEANSVRVVPAAGAMVAVVSFRPLVATGGCTSESSTRAVCPPADHLDLRLGDAGDFLEIDAAVTAPATVRDGSGSDTMHGGGGQVTFSNNAGSDSFHAGP